MYENNWNDLCVTKSVLTLYNCKNTLTYFSVTRVSSWLLVGLPLTAHWQS